MHNRSPNSLLGRLQRALAATKNYRPIDELCTEMRRIGIDASVVPQSLSKQYRDLGREQRPASFAEWITVGPPPRVIEIAGSPIAWVYFMSSGTADWTETTAHFAVPDKRLSPSLARLVAVESVGVRHFPIFGQVIGLRWQGTDSGHGAIAALNKAEALKVAVLAEFHNRMLYLAAYSSLGGHWDFKVAVAHPFQFFSLAQWKVLEAVASRILPAESTRAAAPSAHAPERVL